MILDKGHVQYSPYLFDHGIQPVKPFESFGTIPQLLVVFIEHRTTEICRNFLDTAKNPFFTNKN